jgi:hypothetical protein
MTDAFESLVKQKHADGRAAAEADRLNGEFAALDKAAVRRLSVDGLSAWQAQFPSGSPQFIFAEQLWKYRLTKRTAFYAVSIAVLSAALGAMATYGLRECGNDKVDGNQAAQQGAKKHADSGQPPLDKKVMNLPASPKNPIKR